MKFRCIFFLTFVSNSGASIYINSFHHNTTLLNDLVMEEFEHLLVKQAPIEAYAEWFDSIVEEYVLKDEVRLCKKNPDAKQSETTNLNIFSFRKR